jgi:CubicO group peptidase (beta-lactamase class C family)
MQRMRKHGGDALKVKPRTRPAMTYGRRAILGGVAALPVMVLAGCGGDDDPPSTTEGTLAADNTKAPTKAATTPAVVATSTAGASQSPGSSELYFPPVNGGWETADAAETGWSPAGLEKLVELVKANRSATFMMLVAGRILTENYFGAATASFSFDIASAQKSVTSTLIGIARDKGLLKLDDKVSQYLPVGWSQAAPADESKITIQHLITMTSGLDPTSLRKVAEPGTVFAYNTDAYQKTRPLLEKAAGKDINTITREWLFNPIGVSDQTRWQVRPNAAKDATGEAPWGLSMTVRDMARFGLVSQHRGLWEDKQLVSRTWYDEAWASSEAQRDYGYLWWLMGKRNIPGAPGDWVAALGARDQKIYVVPSLDLVVTRQGLAAGEETENTSNFDIVLFRAIAAARA